MQQTCKLIKHEEGLILEAENSQFREGAGVPFPFLKVGQGVRSSAFRRRKPPEGGATTHMLCTRLIVRQCTLTRNPPVKNCDRVNPLDIAWHGTKKTVIPGLTRRARQGSAGLGVASMSVSGGQARECMFASSQGISDIDRGNSAFSRRDPADRLRA